MTEHIVHVGGTPWALVYAAIVSVVGGTMLSIYRQLRGESVMTTRSASAPDAEPEADNT